MAGTESMESTLDRNEALRVGGPNSSRWTKWDLTAPS